MRGRVATGGRFGSWARTSAGNTLDHTWEAADRTAPRAPTWSAAVGPGGYSGGGFQGFAPGKAFR